MTKCEAPIKMSAARFLPLLASINGSEGGMLLAAAQNVEALPSVSRHAQLRTEARVLDFHLCMPLCRWQSRG